MGTPSVADHAAQQALRSQCYDWLTHEGSAVAKYMHACDGHRDTSSWAPSMLKKLKAGKERPGTQMGFYANEAALRAMAALENVHLVVVDAQSGSGKHISNTNRGRPFDRVTVYEPGTKTDALSKQKSWANGIAPALLDPKPDKPKYRIILHNGEKPGSAGGHFDSTQSLL